MEKTLLAFSHFADAISQGKTGIFFSDYSPAYRREFYSTVGDYELVSFESPNFPVFSIVDWEGSQHFNYNFKTVKTHQDDFTDTADFRPHRKAFSAFNFTQKVTAKAEWIEKVEAVITAQKNGEAWVLNLAHDYASGEFTDIEMLKQDLLQIFYRFLSLDKSHSAGIVITNEQIFCSMSPELFIRQKDGHILASPIKGTGTKDYLNHSAKEKSELDMVTDLLRNDLGQISRKVVVLNERFLVAEKNFHSAHSLISATFPCDLTEGKYRLLLPAGSISGAPKARVVKLIKSLETFDRDFYTGTMGVRLSATDSVWNILIRTIFVDLTAHRWSFPVGVGLTAESDPLAEWEETWQKARLLADLSS